MVETAGLENILEVTFSGGLTATGASILIGTNDSFEQGPDARRDIVAGSAIVATIPEPATLGLIGIVALGRYAAARRRRQG